MRQDYTDITIILDRSGSMISMREGADEGLARFIAEQKGVPGKIRFTLWQFDTEIEKVYEGTPDPPAHRCVPRGGTALYDCIQKAIDSTGERLAKKYAEARPGKVVFLVVSDGEENSSRVATAASVGAKIAEQSSNYNWQFTFIGTNQDAMLSAGKIQIRGDAALNFQPTNDGMLRAFCTSSAATAIYSAGMTNQISYTKAQQDYANGSAAPAVWSDLLKP